MRPTAGDAEHAIADCEAWHVASNAHGFAGVLETGDVRGRARRSRIAALALVDVCPVEPGGAHANQQVFRSRLRRVDVADLEHLGPAGTGNDDGSHWLYARDAVVERQYARLRTNPKPRSDRGRTAPKGLRQLRHGGVHTCWHCSH